MNTKPTIIILVGITGDLAKRKLLPAIESLKEKGMLPEQFKLVGVTRREDPELFKMDLDNPADYQRLKEYLDSIEKEWSVTPRPQEVSAERSQRLFYLSVAPTVSLSIIKLLGESGLSTIPDTKLLLEKPFGTNLENGKEIIATIAHYFSEEQIYRIDHYIQKDSVRALLEQHYESKDLASIEIFASEKIGIEGRGDFYEQTGALLDFVQSHLLEVVAMVINPKNRLGVLKNLYVPSPSLQSLRRAQYKGYREVVGKPDSMVETFVSVMLRSTLPELSGLSVVLKTGKALDKKNTDITIIYKDGATQVISLNDYSNAYENVFAEAINGDKTFFLPKEEVLENWRIVTPIQEAWKKSSSDLTFYPQGSSL